jgi:Flp pilus assembly protein TadD
MRITVSAGARVFRAYLPRVPILRSSTLVLVALVGWRSARAQAPIAAQLQHAVRLMDAGDWQKAEQTLQVVLRAHPNDADALNLLGVATVKQGRVDEAEAIFRKATKSNPSLPAAWLNLAQLYERRDDKEHGLQTLQEGLSHAPHDPRLLSETATLLADRGQFAEAVRRLQAVPSAARFSDYWELLGRVYLSNSDFAKAEEALLRALHGKPESVTLLRQLTGIALKRGDTARAWQYVARALRLAPNSPELLYEYAQVSLQNKLSSEAVLAMRKALLMEPDRPDFLFFLGDALLDTSDFHEALPYFRRYVELRPDDPRGHLSLGWALFLEKSFPEARQHLEETLRLDAKQADAWYHLGMIAYETNDSEKALEFLTHALEVDPGHARAHWGLGMVYSREGRYEKSRDEFEAAAHLDPDEPKVHYQLSQVYARLGESERARSELQLYQEAQKKSDERIKLSQRLPSRVRGGQPRP